jgi:hypothetical protein
MHEQRPHLTKYFTGLLALLLGLVSCLPPPNQAPVIHELICPAEVPASFDSMITCGVTSPGNNKVQFQWSADNGTIRGDQESIAWTAPAVYGTYKIDVKATDISGIETVRQASINVLPFYQSTIDPDPEINLKLTLWGSGTVSEQSLVRPLTTSEISCDAPLSGIKKYQYIWACNGGKLLGTGIKDGTASKIGWVAPGVPGYYTVTVKASDNWGNTILGSVYCQVKNPACCEK